MNPWVWAWATELVGGAVGGWSFWGAQRFFARRHHRRLQKQWLAEYDGRSGPVLPHDEPGIHDARIGALAVTKLLASGEPIASPEVLPFGEGEATKHRLDAVSSAPRYGRPERILYRGADFEEPLRCSGAACAHREIAEGEAIQVIPLLDEPDGLVAVCHECEVTVPKP